MSSLGEGRSTAETPELGRGMFSPSCLVPSTSMYFYPAFEEMTQQGN